VMNKFIRRMTSGLESRGFQTWRKKIRDDVAAEERCLTLMEKSLQKCLSYCVVQGWNSWKNFVQAAVLKDLEVAEMKKSMTVLEQIGHRISTFALSKGWHTWKLVVSDEKRSERLERICHKMTNKDAYVAFRTWRFLIYRAKATKHVFDTFETDPALLEELVDARPNLAKNIVTPNVLSGVLETDTNMLAKALVTNPNITCPVCHDAKADEFFVQNGFEYPAEWKSALDGVRKADELSFKQTINLIFEIYQKKVKADKADDDVNNARDDMLDFVKDFMEFKYGKNARVWKSLCRTLQANSPKKQEERNAFFHIFTRFLGVSIDSLDQQALDFSMDALRDLLEIKEVASDKNKFPLSTLNPEKADKKIASIAARVRFKKEVMDRMSKQMKALVKSFQSEKCVGIENVFVILVDAYCHHLEVGPAPEQREEKPLKKEASKGKGQLTGNKESPAVGKVIKREPSKASMKRAPSKGASRKNVRPGPKK